MRRVELYAHEANWPGFTPPRWPVFTPPLTPKDFPMTGLQQVIEQSRMKDATCRILLFGDFAKQAIYDASTRRRGEVAALFPGIANFCLSVNCRGKSFANWRICPRGNLIG
jgi:hypothetical protein